MSWIRGFIYLGTTKECTESSSQCTITADSCHILVYGFLVSLLVNNVMRIKLNLFVLPLRSFHNERIVTFK